MTIMKISQRLQWALEEHADSTRSTVTMNDDAIADALCEQLGFGRFPNSDARKVLLVVTEALDDTFRAGSPKKPTEWAQKVMLRAVKDLVLEDAHWVLIGLGLDDRTIEGEPKVKQLAATLKRMIVLEMSEAIVEMLGRWNQRGDFDFATQRRRMNGPADLGARRDRAAEPRYQPPGRAH